MLAGILLAGAMAASQAPTTPEGRELVSAIAASITGVRQKQADLPPPKDDTERLLRLSDLDQAPRRVITTFDFSRIPEPDRAVALAHASAQIEAVDAENLETLLRMVPPEGWFLRSRYGDKAAASAFHIVQHSNLATQKRFLPVLEGLAGKGEVDGQNYGMMFDRVAISEGRPQRYGSQFRCDGGKWRPYPLEDAGHIDALRARMGFHGTFAEYKVHFDTSPPCPQTRSPPPPGMRLD